MSGHNKWSKIKRQKGATDAAKSKMFTKMALLIANASRQAKGDVSSPAVRAAIEKARQGTDQASDVMQISLTNMAGAGVRFGIPVLVAPSVATIFIGEPYDEAYPLAGGGIGFRRTASMVMTFDHRISNGIGAANFLADIRKRVDALTHDV